MPRRRHTFLLAAVTAGTLTMAACSSTGTHQAAAVATRSASPIGYSALFLQDPAQSSMVAVFHADAKTAGIITLAPTSANNDAGQQDTDIRNLVAEGAHSLMVIPADASAVVPPIKYAMSKGIPVATLMLGPSGGTTSVSLQVDNKQVGAQSCTYLGNELHGHGTVLEILGDMRQTTAQDRHAGFTTCMKARYAHITVITKTGGEWDPATAAASAADVLNSDPGLGGIFMASDGYITGVAHAIRAAGHTAPAGKLGHVYTIAVDGTPTALAAIRNHTLDAENVQPVNLFVQYALAYLQLLHEGKTIPLGPTNHVSTVVRTKDGYPADVFSSVLVTSSNVNSSGLWANHTA